MSAVRHPIDPRDPRAPSREVWACLSEAERAAVVASLPSEVPLALPPEGDAHRLPKHRALEALSEHYRRLRRRVYLSAELPVYYPDEAMFAPDLLAVVEVEDHERASWVVSHEGKGLDFVLEINVSGDRRKDFEENVVRYARLGIPEYFAFDVPRSRLLGWRLPDARARAFDAIVPQGGRWPSQVLELDLGLEEGQLRFFSGTGPLPDARELIARLSTMVDGALRRAEDEARRAEDEARRAEDEARRAEDEARRAEDEARRAEDEARRADKLAARLRELGVDPDDLD
ncbi:MAG: Uma2 family endonuclease [Polyangiaceae bacterium]|nr:Uma2 family endonuclease [Polyangiaceae bacterium]